MRWCVQVVDGEGQPVDVSTTPRFDSLIEAVNKLCAILKQELSKENAAAQLRRSKFVANAAIDPQILGSMRLKVTVEASDMVAIPLTETAPRESGIAEAKSESKFREFF